MSRATLTELGPGEVPVHRFCGEAEFRGAGVAAAKSAALSSVSVHPLLARAAADVLEGAAVEPVPSKSLALP
jgi:hypothetical protein